MKERKDLQRMSAAMMRVKSPLKLQTEDKKTVASSSYVKLKDKPKEDYTKSEIYQKIVQDKKDLEKAKELEKIARQSGQGTSKQFETASVAEKRRLLLARRSGVLPASNIVNK